MRNFLLKYKNPARLINYAAIKFLGKTIGGFNDLSRYFNGKTGLEIGGPSRIFRAGNYIPIYPIAKSVDGCNFSNQTIWENTIREGRTYDFGKAEKGFQYIADAIDLHEIPDEQYDFVLSSHSLEHIANPFKALTEWLRVLKKGGLILVIVPDPKFTFDNKRPLTSFDHLIADLRDNTDEGDQTHVEEILSLHDISLDPGISDLAAFRKRSYDNLNNRSLHHHVFSIELLEKIFDHFKVKVVCTDVAPPFNLIIAGIK
jgi:SAM-dependent methyltransferase